MKGIIELYYKSMNIVSSMMNKKDSNTIPVCIFAREIELEEVYYTIQSLVDTNGLDRLEIRVICQKKHNIDKKKLYFSDNKDVNVSIVQANDWMGQMADYEKWIYLMPGCIVCQSLKELFEIDLQDLAFAAALCLKNRMMYRYIQNHINLKPDTYVDTSVMLIHEPVLRQHYLDIQSKFACRQYEPSALQDILNQICVDKIYILDQKWNCSWQTVFADSRNEFLLYEDNLRYQESMRFPAILNYTGIYKPWKYPIRGESGYFWRTAKNTSFFEQRVKSLSQMTGVRTELIRDEIEAAIMKCRKQNL